MNEGWVAKEHFNCTNTQIYLSLLQTICNYTKLMMTFYNSEDEAGTSGTSKKVKSSSVTESPSEYSHWLMKSEPETRMENGVDVKVG